MSKPFTVNINRFDPYKTYRFHIFFEQSTTPVAGVSKVTGIKRSSDPIADQLDHLNSVQGRPARPR